MKPTLLLTLALALPATAQDPSCGNWSSGPDVIVGNLTDLGHYSSVGPISAYSIGTDACNFGDAPLVWQEGNNQHPVIAQHMYRYEDGRFEQLGISWLKHGFGALAQNTCCTCQNPNDLALLGVGCSDPYTSDLNGDQDGWFGGYWGGLGPRSEVNPSTGDFPWPYTTMGQSGDNIYKRLQVQTSDMDPNLHPDALYFAEGHYVTPHDAAAGNQHNNASYREVRTGTFANNQWILEFASSTTRMRSAIYAWQAIDPGVTLSVVDDDGRMILGSNATDNGDGTWSYEYALYNMNSDRSISAIYIPLSDGSTPTALGFNDVEHRENPWSVDDWTPVISAGDISWSTDSYSVNPDANAIRWGTLYNFRFTCDAAPTTGLVNASPFKPGTGIVWTFDAQVPGSPSGCDAQPYCAVTPNSTGSAASLTNGGSTSISADDLVLTAGPVPNQPGIFYYGPNQIEVPFGDGYRCIGGTVRRMPVSTATGGNLSRSVDYSANYAAGFITAGSSWNFQAWFRDPAANGATFNLSNGLHITFCP